MPQLTTDAPLDLNVLIELTGCDDSMLPEFLSDFQQVAAEAWAQMQGAIRQRHLAKLSSAAHRVKSSARYVGALRLGQLSEELEKAAAAGDTASVPGALARWHTAWRAADQFVTEHLRAQAAGGDADPA